MAATRSSSAATWRTQAPSCELPGLVRVRAEAVSLPLQHSLRRLPVAGEGAEMLHARSQWGAAAGLAAGCCAAARARLRARGGRVDLQALRRGQRGRAVALQLLHGRQARLGRGRRAARGVALAPRVRQLGLQAAGGRGGVRLVALQLLHGGRARLQRGHLPAAGQVWRALLIASTSR